MFTIIYGKQGSGKSGLLAYIGNEAAFDIERNITMQNEIRQHNSTGFHLTVPQHAVSSNVRGMMFQQPYTYIRLPRLIDPSRLGVQTLAPTGVKCHFTLPYETILIDEAQRYFYSKGKPLDKYQLDFFSEARHNDLNVYMTTPAAMDIDKDIRRLSQFWKIISRELKHKRDGSVETVWIIHSFEGGENAVEDYEKGKLKFEKIVIKAPYDIFDFYNHQINRSMYLMGHLDEDFDRVYDNNVSFNSIEDYRREEKLLKGKL